MAERSPHAIVIADAPTPAPVGLIDFCLRTSECVASAQPSGAKADATPTETLHSAHRQVSAPGASARLGLMLDAAAAAPSAPGQHARVQLTPQRWRELVLLNRTINHAIEAASDESQFGVGERWSMPILEAQHNGEAPRGDCEDYALEKRARLLAAGWPRDTVALAIARLPQQGLHTVLIAQTDRGDFVLDNLQPYPVPSTALDYQWVSRQAGYEMSHWARARLSLVPDG